MSEERKRNKRYTYPRVMFERKLEEYEGVPTVMMMFGTTVINTENREVPVELISFYPFFGKRDNEIEVDSANVFHQMCREAYLMTRENEELEDDVVDTNFNENDERW